MSQTFTDDLYEQSYVADTTQTNMENNFAALKSSFSGGAAPSNPVGFMLWGDTSAGDECLKRRNDANDAWLAILCGDASQKMWIYRNDTCEGWIVDATVTDRVLAIKGGSDAYNVNGGVNAGTWTQPGHTLVTSEMPDHDHSFVADGAHGHNVTIYSSGNGANTVSKGLDGGALVASGAAVAVGNHDHSFVGTGGDGSHNHGSTHRPAAAVGTLQYPDL